MDIFQLRIFSLAAKYQSFSKVAAALFISPPSVSKYIASLESEVQRQLFIRDGRRIILTDFGENFLLYANEILEKEEAAQQFLSNNMADEDIRYIGVISHMEGAPVNFYTEILAAKRDFETEHPEIAVKIRFHDYEDLQGSLTSGAVDIALFSICNPEIPFSLPNGMAYKKLNHFRYSLALPPAAKAADTLAEAALQIRTLAFTNTPAPKRLAREFMADYRIAPKLVPMGHWGHCLMKMISGECATLVSENMCAAVEQAGAHVYDLPEDKYSNGLYALWWPNEAKTCVDDLVQSLADHMTYPAQIK